MGEFGWPSGVPIRLNSRLVFVKTHVRVQSRHAHIDAWFSRNVVGIAFGKLSLLKNVLRQFNHVDVVVVAACHVDGPVDSNAHSLAAQGARSDISSPSGPVRRFGKETYSGQPKGKPYVVDASLTKNQARSRRSEL